VHTVMQPNSGGGAIAVEAAYPHRLIAHVLLTVLDSVTA